MYRQKKIFLKQFIEHLKMHFEKKNVHLDVFILLTFSKNKNNSYLLVGLILIKIS